VIMVGLPVLMVVGLFRPSKHSRWIVGTSARFAAALGGTKRTPMQA
jgi:hypothetical protein